MVSLDCVSVDSLFHSCSSQLLISKGGNKFGISYCGLFCLHCLVGSAVSVAAALSALQARPATKLPEKEEDEQGEEKEEEEKDLSIPGSSYVKLMTLTPVSVLPGKLHSCCGQTSCFIMVLWCFQLGQALRQTQLAVFMVGSHHVGGQVGRGAIV